MPVLVKEYGGDVVSGYFILTPEPAFLVASLAEPSAQTWPQSADG